MMLDYLAAENWLRVRVFLIVILALVPAGAVAYANLVASRDAHRADAEDWAIAEASFLAAQQDTVVAATEQTLALMSTGPSILGNDTARCIAAVQRINATFPHYNNLGLVDPDGYVRCAAQAPEVAVYAGDTAVVKAVTATGGFAQGSYELGLITGQLGITYGRPVTHEDGAPRGILFAAINLTGLQRIAEMADRDDTSVVIIEEGGELLVRAKDIPVEVGQRWPDAELVAELARGAEATATTVDGEPFLVGIARLPSAGAPHAYLLVAQRIASVESSATEAFASQLIILGATLAVALVAAVAVAERLVIRETTQRMDLRASRIQRLQDQDARHIRLANSIGHDLASPLTPIRLQLLLMRKRGVDEAHGRSLDIIDRNLTQVQRLVKDMRDLFGLEAGRLSIRPAPVDVAAILLAARDSTHEHATDNRVTLSVKASPGLDIEADQDRLYQVLFNLVNNAIRFSPANRTITLRAIPVDDGVEVTVQDEGRGLSESEMALLFQPFSQVHDPKDVSEKGTGLGLYICRGIIEGHGGRIGVRSQGLGHGATFWFWLPRRAQMPVEAVSDWPGL